MATFELLMSPFIFIIKKLFLLSYSLTGNYGLSIILLSFGISLLLLPIFILIEKAKKRDNAVKQKMKPQLDEIKRCYNGQERYYYIKTLNRQHNFSPLRSLIPILSLLLQIPFFIAAYQFLEHYEPLVGVGFLFINDLSAPDALFGVVNFLPIAMTLVNLLTAYFYTRNGDTSERKQMLGIATVFLILLFNLPSGLVLYWTMNNVFSFFRLFVTNPEVFRKSESSASINSIKLTELKLRLKLLVPKLKVTFWVLVLLSIALQINWAFDNNFDTIWFRLIGAVVFSVAVTVLSAFTIIIFARNKHLISKIQIQPKVYFSLFFLAIYFYLASEFYFTGVNAGLNYLSILLLIPLQIIGVLYVIRQAEKTNKYLLNITSFLLIFVFISQLFNLIVLLDGKEITFSLLNINISVTNSTLSHFIISGFVFLLITLSYYINYQNITLIKPSKSNWLIYIFAVIYITGYIFFWNPLMVYSSSPETFNFPAINLLRNNLNLFLITSILLLIVFLILPKKIKRIWLLFILIIVTLCFIYSSIIPINLGSLQESRFSEQEKLAAPLYKYLFESILLIGIFMGVKWFYQKQSSKIINGILIVLNVFLIGQSFHSVLKTNHFFKSGKEQKTTQPNELKPIPFSKDQKNIIFFIADGFQGWFIKQIMEDNPELKDVFKGFVWYPNTLSMANYTHASLPSLLAGFDYSVSKMNENFNLSIEEKMRAASRQFIQKAKSQGYYYSSEFVHYSNFDDPLVDNTIPYWKDSWRVYEENINLGLYQELWYKRLYENALFNMVPLFLKPKIYNDKKWLAFYRKEKISGHSFSRYNFMRLLPYISNNTSTKPNFIYFHNAAAHNPWYIVTNNGTVIPDVSPYKNNEWYMKQLGKWVEWMKENEVYDNTKIILISDHGPTWDQYDGELDFESPLILDSNNPKKIWDRHFWRLNALLLVKDFNSNEYYKEDWRLMSNADGFAIAFDENNPTKGDSISRTLPTYWTFWASKMIENKTMEVNKHFEVTNNIFDLNNWKTIK